MGSLDLPVAEQQGLCDLTFLWLEITAKCNLECRHCYADSGPHQDLLGSMSTNDWLTLIRDSADLGCHQVQFIGGEPTLHPDLLKMISFASTRGYTFIEVFTNATAISNRILETFVNYRVQIAVSFYSDEAMTHDSITRRKGSFDRTVAGIKRMIGAGLSVRAGIIEMAQNMGHAPKAQRFLEALGVMQISTDLQRGVGRGSTSASLNDPMEVLCGECWKGKLCVTSSGQVYPCVFSRFADLGTVNHGIREIVAGDSLARFRLNLSKNVRGTTLDALATPCEPNCAPPGRFCIPSAQNCGPLAKCMPSNQPCIPDSSRRPELR